MLQPVRDSFASGVPIRWVRVHDLPDFVYFDHSIHVRKGIGCVECHGRVDRMPLTVRAEGLQMEWCLRCHRQPQSHLRPRSEVFNMSWRAPDDATEMRSALARDYHITSMTDCTTCHR